MPFVNVDGARMYYRLDRGFDSADSRPVLVLSHSLGLDHGQWDVQIPDLLPHYQVLRYDLRGHGASDPTPGDYTMELLGRDVLGIVDALGIGRFAFCGQSIGGMIGQSVAAFAPDRVTHLILASTTSHVDPAHMMGRRAKVLQEGVGAIQDMVMQRYFSAETLAENPPQVGWARHVHLACSVVGYAGCCMAIATMDQRPLLPRIRAATLVIGGDRDTATPWVGHGNLIAASIARAKTVQLSASHIANIDQPRAFTAAVLEFLKPAAASA